MTQFIRLVADDSGTALVDYAVISAVLSVTMIAALTAIATACATALSATSANMTSLGTTPP